MWNELFSNFSNALNEGNGGKGINIKYGPDWIFNQHLQTNIATFTAFKNHANTVDMVKQLIDSDGNMKSFNQWRKDITTIVGNYNNNWLQAEYQTAVASSRMAAKWQNFQRRKDTYPNLQYKTQQDGRVRDEHQSLEGIIRPIDDPFWKTHFPPNGWRCRCFVIQTDRKAKQVPYDAMMPDKEFQNNVGQTAEIFTPDHPYFDTTLVNEKRVQQAAVKYQTEKSKTDVTKWATKNIVGKALSIPGLKHSLSLTATDIQTITAAPYPNEPLRNNMLYVLKDIMSECKLTKTYPGEGQFKEWLIYTATIDGVNTVFNVYEDTSGRYGLYSITN